ncbi:sulfite exporter TauE/SafE family protein [Alteraurantiacibacter aquimixticola]|uniref:Probable membrane transporter protein n=1 Tax=Alteraurantiacibacter aquimixticola TaxID=2489173 RepID=A0A4T3F1Q3_9SPHN|nr:sulfite exporter TauE/SafE family protein [Alteraurantiacibacter aquimixticola]TIX49292.1 sulfite exporter TauE/SafE family protein [Alteraurantiacibacter aquimixticola]
MPPEAWAAAIAAALAAGFVRGLAGFGLSVVLVPVLQLAISPQVAVFVGLVSLFLIGLTDIGRIRRDADKSAIPITVIAIAATPLGMWALTALPADWARVLIAMVSLGAFVLVVIPLGRVKLARHPAMAISGVATGFLGGFAGMPGPGMGPFYLRGRLEPKVARASMMAIFLLLTPLSVAFFLWRGVATWQDMLLALALFVPVLIGDWFGHRAFGRVSARQWQAATALVLGSAATIAVSRLV